MLAFPIRFLIRSVYPVSRSRLVIVVACRYSLSSRLSSRFIRLAGRLVCLFAFSFPPWVVSLVVSFYLVSLLRLVILLPHSLCSSPFVALLVRSSGFRFIAHFCLSSSFVSCPVASIVVFILVVRLSPSCVSCSSAFPYCRPLDIPYETSDAHDVPLIYSLGHLPQQSQWGTDGEIELTKTARMDIEERKRHANETLLSHNEADNDNGHDKGNETPNRGDETGRRTRSRYETTGNTRR